MESPHRHLDKPRRDQSTAGQPVFPRIQLMRAGDSGRFEALTIVLVVIDIDPELIKLLQ